MSRSSLVSSSLEKRFSYAATQKDEKSINQILKNELSTEEPFDINSLQSLNSCIPELIETISSYVPHPSPLHTPPLHYAAFTGDKKSFNPIDQSKCNMKDLKGLTPLHYALLAKQKDIVEMLIPQIDLSYLTPQNNSYLHYAAMSDDPELLSLLLKQNMDVLCVNQHHLTPAHIWAACSKNLEGFKQLAEAGGLHHHSIHPLSPIAILILKMASAETNPWDIRDFQLLGIDFLKVFISVRWMQIHPLVQTDKVFSWYEREISNLAEQVLSLINHQIVSSMLGPSSLLKYAIVPSILRKFTNPKTHSNILLLDHICAAVACVSLTKHMIECLRRPNVSKKKKFLAVFLHFNNLSAAGIALIQIIQKTRTFATINPLK